MPFTAEELAAMRAADEEIERNFSGMTAEERALARRLEASARRSGYTEAQRKKAEYYQQNRERICARKKVWAAQNAEKMRAYNRVYYQRHREEILQRQKEWYRENHERRRESGRRYYDKHREEICAKARERRKGARENEAVAAL